MPSLAYENLARDVLVMLIESGDLKAVDRDRLIAYETYHLPPFVDLELPDVDGYERLLNPHTTEEHCRHLAQSILHIVSTEERNTWVDTTGQLQVLVELSTTGAPRAHPRYEVDAAEPQEDEEVAEFAEALVRVEIEGKATVFRRGRGMQVVVNRALRPRVSLREAPEGVHEIAHLLVGGPTTVHTEDGRVQDYDAHASIPVVHDLTFETRGRRFRPWERPVEGRVKVLGVSRARRPSLVLAPLDRDVVEWDRNRKPRITTGSAEGADLPTGDLQLSLESGAGDHVEVETLDHRSVFVTWFDGAPLLVPSDKALPLRGSHLQALGHGEDAVAVSVAGASPTREPRLIEVRGWMPRRATGADPLSRLFGFEQPVATIFEEGKILDPEASGEPIRVPVLSPALVRPLFVLALDGTRGCKLKPLTAQLEAEDFDLHIDAWSWIEGVIGLTLPGLRLRLEALGRVKLIYSEPHLVTEVSGDPEDEWQHQGWRFRVTPATLDVAGHGRVDLTVDQRQVRTAAELPALREHRVQVGRGLFRIVRREVAG